MNRTEFLNLVLDNVDTQMKEICRADGYPQIPDLYGFHAAEGTLDDKTTPIFLVDTPNGSAFATSRFPYPGELTEEAAESFSKRLAEYLLDCMIYPGYFGLSGIDPAELNKIKERRFSRMDADKGILEAVMLGLSDYFADNNLSVFPVDGFLNMISENSQLVCRLNQDRILDDIADGLNQGWLPEEIKEIEIQRLVPTVEQYLEDTKEIPKEIEQIQDFQYAKKYLLPALLPKDSVPEGIFKRELDDDFPLKDAVEAYVLLVNDHATLVPRELIMQWAKTASPMFLQTLDSCALQNLRQKMTYIRIDDEGASHTYTNFEAFKRDCQKCSESIKDYEFLAPCSECGTAALLLVKDLLNELDMSNRHFAIKQTSYFADAVMVFSPETGWFPEKDILGLEAADKQIQEALVSGGVEPLFRGNTLIYAGKEGGLLTPKEYLTLMEQEKTQEDYTR